MATDAGEEVERVKQLRSLVAVMIILSAAVTGRCADDGVVLEIAVANQSASAPSGSDWGWWTPAKYPAGWAPDEGSSATLADLRMLVLGETYTVILAGEWYPDLEAEGAFTVPGVEQPVVQQLRLETAIYDLGYGLRLGRDRRNFVLPWIGATYMDIDESLTTEPPPSSTIAAGTDHASAGLWGVVVGADGSVTLWRTLDLAGRLLFRWATGDRDATMTTQEPGGGSSGGTVEVTDSIGHTMWGLDIGVRWRATRAIGIEAGWRLRDRSLDDGPARFDGPQLKLAIRF
jgi:hypothetical protein